MAQDQETSLAAPFQKDPPAVVPVNQNIRTETVFGDIQKHISNANQHYQDHQGHLNRSFNLAARLTTGGFGILALAIIFFLWKGQEDVKFSAITAIIGGLVSFLGGLCLRMHERNLSHQQSLFEDVTRTKELLLAVDLCQSISTVKQRDQVKENLSYKILESRTSKSASTTGKKTQGRIRQNRRRRNRASQNQSNKEQADEAQAHTPSETEDA